MRNYLAFVTTAVLLSSCTYDNLEYGDCTEVEGCAEIPISTGFFGYQEVMQGVHYGAPCFNPNNPDEFVYFEQDWSSGLPQNKLVIYDLNTGQSEILLEDVLVLREPIWTRKNEIYFWHSSWDIFRMKPDGTALENVTNMGGCRWPVVNPDGTLLYFYYNPDNSINTGLVMDTESLEVVDTTLGGWFSDWSEEVGLVSEGLELVNTVQVENMESEVIYDYEIEHYAHDVSDSKYNPISDEIYFTIYRKGLHKVGIWDKSHTQLKWSCDTRDFTSISMHPNGKQMLAQLIKNKKVNESQIDVTSEIWMMDTDGCNAYCVLP